MQVQVRMRMRMLVLALVPALVPALVLVLVPLKPVVPLVLLQVRLLLLSEGV